MVGRRAGGGPSPRPMVARRAAARRGDARCRPRSAARDPPLPRPPPQPAVFPRRRARRQVTYNYADLVAGRPSSSLQSVRPSYILLPCPLLPSSSLVASPSRVSNGILHPSSLPSSPSSSFPYLRVRPESLRS
jgi:hypothetical protein